MTSSESETRELGLVAEAHTVCLQTDHVCCRCGVLLPAGVVVPRAVVSLSIPGGMTSFGVAWHLSCWTVHMNRKLPPTPDGKPAQPKETPVSTPLADLDIREFADTGQWRCAVEDVQKAAARLLDEKRRLLTAIELLSSLEAMGRDLARRAREVACRIADEVRRSGA